MPRVLILSWEYPPIVEGGLARHVRKLAEGLVRLGVEVHVLARGGGHLAAVEDRHGVTVHRVREPEFPKDDLDAFVRWVDAMNDDMRAAGAALGDSLSFDLVHSHDWLVAGAARKLARRFGCPWLVTVHATEHGRHQGWVNKHPQRQIHGVERRMVRAADGVITCSHSMRGHVAEVFGIDEDRVTVVPNGVDPGDLQPVADLPRLRARYAAPEERLVLLVGRLVVPGGERVGLRFRARDSASLATMMEKVLSDDVLRDRLVAEASEHILRFDWADVARRTAEVYAELVAAGQPAA